MTKNKISREEAIKKAEELLENPTFMHLYLGSKIFPNQEPVWSKLATYQPNLVSLVKFCEENNMKGITALAKKLSLAVDKEVTKQLSAARQAYRNVDGRHPKPGYVTMTHERVIKILPKNRK